MLLRNFTYTLPHVLIAQTPATVRSDCRLLTLHGASGAITHRHFKELVTLLHSGDLLVFNNTQVIPARLHGHKLSGGRVEALVERLLNQQRILAHLRLSKRPAIGSQLIFYGQKNHDRIQATVTAQNQGLFELQLHDPRPLLTILQTIGQIPLPPYIHRPVCEEDRQHYQTLYAEIPGAVAAPTAGLHFDQPLLDALQAKGVIFSTITLHVGAGTFQPVRVPQVEDHRMHAEQIIVPATTRAALRACKARGNRVIAVGTTTVRALESIAQQADRDEEITFKGKTRLFIYPGSQFRVVDAVITNFHLPRSTPLILVCAFAGQQQTLNAYKEAIAHHYRFFSYGDAMLVTPTPHAISPTCSMSTRTIASAP